MEVLKSINSWTHILAAFLSIIVGTVIVVTNKGSKRHKKLGMWYCWLMIVNNATSLFIIKAFGRWFFPHYLALIGLAVLVPGYGVTRFKRWRHWLKVHILCMMFSYYLLVGGAVNEAFLHIPGLRPLIENQAPSYLLATTVAFLVCLVITVYFLVRYRRFGRQEYKLDTQASGS